MEYHFEDIDFSIENNKFDFENRIIKPKLLKEPNESYLQFDYAIDLAKQIDLNKTNYIIVNGSFIFGDLIEQCLLKKIYMQNH